MKVLIIEDELPAARQLSKLLASAEPVAEVLAVLDSVESAVNWLSTQPAPDLLFMDIQLADGLSFDILRQVEVRAPIIFTTAFDQYAVQAFRVNAVDYLLKPVDPHELTEALHKIQQTERPAAPNLEALLQMLQPPKEPKARFLVKSGPNLSYLLTTDIAYFRSEEGITFAHTFGDKRHIIEHSMEELEQQLSAHDFFRINRSMTIRLTAIHKIAPYFNGRLKLELLPPLHEDVFVSRERVNNFKLWLGG